MLLVWPRRQSLHAAAARKASPVHGLHEQPRVKQMVNHPLCEHVGAQGVFLTHMQIHGLQRGVRAIGRL